jgi:Protein of unknown function (DUF2585)
MGETSREKPRVPGITSRHWIVTSALFVTAGLLEFRIHRPVICPCGTVKLWEGVVNSAGNSQHISDWYSFSHVIHGLLFYGLSWLVWRHRPLGHRLVAAALIELCWELLENSSFVIDRYRAATIAVGYSGDSILNSMCDGSWMITGFLLASRLPWRASASLAIAFELFTLAMIRDNLTLNIVMLVHPVDAIRLWQAGA